MTQQYLIGTTLSYRITGRIGYQPDVMRIPALPKMYHRARRQFQHGEFSKCPPCTPTCTPAQVGPADTARALPLPLSKPLRMLPGAGGGAGAVRIAGISGWGLAGKPACIGASALIGGMRAPVEPQAPIVVVVVAPPVCRCRFAYRRLHQMEVPRHRIEQR